MRVRGQPVTQRTVADLVVVLRRHDQPLRRRPGQLAHNAVQRAERGVVAVLLAGQQGMQLVMQIVEPHRVVAPLLERPEVVVTHLARHEPVDAIAQLAQHVHRRVVVDRVHGVEPQAVDAVVARPHDRVLDRPLADSALGVVDRLPPEGVVAVGEVRPECTDRLGAGADVVVDDIEQDAEPFAVCRIDQPGEPLRAAVGEMRRRGVDAVVPPAPVARKRGDRHQFDGGDP